MSCYGCHTVLGEAWQHNGMCTSFIQCPGSVRQASCFLGCTLSTLAFCFLDADGSAP
jgi:hypothetical protein